MADEGKDERPLPIAPADEEAEDKPEGVAGAARPLGAVDTPSLIAKDAADMVVQGSAMPEPKGRQVVELTPMGESAARVAPEAEARASTAKTAPDPVTPGGVAVSSARDDVSMDGMIGVIDSLHAKTALGDDQVAQAVLGVASLTLIFGVITLAISGIDTPSTVDLAFNVIAGLVAFIAGCIGIHGGRMGRMESKWTQCRGELMFFGICCIWGLTTQTTYLFTSVNAEVSGSKLCDRATVGLVRRTVEGCGDNTANTIRIIIALILLALSAFGAYYSFTLAERLQDKLRQLQVRELRKDLEGSKANFQQSMHKVASFHGFEARTKAKYVVEDLGKDMDKKLDQIAERLKMSVGQQAKFMQGLCISQGIFALLGLIIVSVVQSSEQGVGQNVMMVLVTWIASGVGYFSASRRVRSGLQLFYIAQLWGLATVTNFLYAGVKAERSSNLTCAEFKLTNKASLAGVEDVDCDAKRAAFVVRIIIAIIMLGLTLAGSYVSLRLDDKVQTDSDDDARRKLEDEVKEDFLATLPEEERALVNAEGSDDDDIGAAGITTTGEGAGLG